MKLQFLCMNLVLYLFLSFSVKQNVWIHQEQVLPDQPSAFYDGMIPSVSKGRAIDVIYLGCCELFDMVPQNILLSKLDRDGLDGWTVKWEFIGWSHPGDGDQWFRWTSVRCGASRGPEQDHQ